MNLSDLITEFSRYIHRINDWDVSQCCGLAEGTNAHTLKTTNQIVYGVYNQQGLIKAATDNIAMTACAAQGATSFCYYLVSIGTTGTVTTTKGTDNTYALPATPAGGIPIGAFKIVAVATVFTSGTTDLSASGITATFYDIDTGIAALMINKAQDRLERGVTIVRNGRQRTIQDFWHMLVRAQATVVSGATTVTLPFPNYKDFVEVGITDALGIRTPLKKDDTLPLGITITVRPTKIARLPALETTFTLDGAPAAEYDLWPTCDQDYTVDAIAYQYSPTLDNVIYSTDWLTENAPDVLLFGALVESAAYLPSDPRVPEWKDRWQEAVWTLYVSQQKEKSTGSPIYTRFPDPLRMKEPLGMSSSSAGILSYGFVQQGT